MNFWLHRTIIHLVCMKTLINLNSNYFFFIYPWIFGSRLVSIKTEIQNNLTDFWIFFNAGLLMLSLKLVLQCLLRIILKAILFNLQHIQEKKKFVGFKLNLHQHDDWTSFCLACSAVQCSAVQCTYLQLKYSL